MNCKVCGTLMGDMDLFCKVCGAKNGEATEDDVVSYERSNLTDRKGTVESVSESKDNNEFAWNVYEFPKPKKTEDVDIQWPTEDYRKPRRKELDEPICWDLDKKPKKPAPSAMATEEADTFFESIESEFEATRKNILNEYESVKNRKSVFESEDIERDFPQEDSGDSNEGQACNSGGTPTVAQAPVQAGSPVLEEFGEGLPEGFFETVVEETNDLAVQSFDDLPGGYPQRRRSVISDNAEDTKEATKKADRSQFRTGGDDTKESPGKEDVAKSEANSGHASLHTPAKATVESPAITDAPIAAAVIHAAESKIGIEPKLDTAVQTQTGDVIEKESQEETERNDDGGYKKEGTPVKNAPPEEDLGEMEKFFTFSKRSEEFQKLLDKEYDKIQKKNAERPEAGQSRVSGIMSDTLNFTMGEEATLPPLTDTQIDLLANSVSHQELFDMNGSSSEEADIINKGTINAEMKKESMAEGNSGEEALLKGTDQPEENEQIEANQLDVSQRFGFIPRKDRKKKYVQDELAAAQRAAKEIEEQQSQTEPTDTLQDNMTLEPAAVSNTYKRNPYAGHLAEMAAARDSFFRDETGAVTYVPRQNGIGHGETGSSPGDMPSTEVLVTVAVKSSGAQGTTTRQTISMNPLSANDPIITTETSIDPVIDMEKEHKSPLKVDVKPESKADAQAIQEKSEPKELEPAAEIKQSHAVEQTGQQEDQQKSPEQASANVGRHQDGLPFETMPEKKVNDFWVNYSYESDPNEKKFSAGKIALVIIGIILIMEVAALGVTFLMPDSVAAKMVTAVQVKMVEGIQSATDAVTGLFSKEKKEPKENDSEKEMQTSDAQQPQEPSSTPEADKTVLIQKALVHNKNIQIIAKSDSLGLDQSKDYGVKDLNESTLITDNIWLDTKVEADTGAAVQNETTAGADIVYYDQAVVSALVAYDSKWIDYVNTGDKSVFDHIKVGSKAYKNAQAFASVGKIYETFKSLSIGEIRQGERGFYVFTKEVIEKNEGGKITTVTYDWVYYLEPVDGKMMIVNFI